MFRRRDELDEGLKKRPKILVSQGRDSDKGECLKAYILIIELRV